jgi:hypothetical protein
MSLEHVNMWVESIERKTQFLFTAFPDWRTRGEDMTEEAMWRHVGSDKFYITLTLADGTTHDNHTKVSAKQLKDAAAHNSERCTPCISAHLYSASLHISLCPCAPRHRQYYCDGLAAPAALRCCLLLAVITVGASQWSSDWGGPEACLVPRRFPLTLYPSTARP